MGESILDVTILDTQTGERRNATKRFPFSALWWAEGNGSCDCNRSILFGLDDEMDAKQHADNPELKAWQSNCFGHERFLIVECGECEYTLSELNYWYPPELKEKYFKVA